jgi:hypothetical protein
MKLDGKWPDGKFATIWLLVEDWVLNNKESSVTAETVQPCRLQRREDQSNWSNHANGQT